jgi:hypothetical protein
MPAFWFTYFVLRISYSVSREMLLQVSYNILNFPRIREAFGSKCSLLFTGGVGAC